MGNRDCTTYHYLLFLLCFIQNLILGQKKGAAGIKPATAGSAIPCSTADLSTHENGVQKLNPNNFLFFDRHGINGKKRGRAGIEPATSRTRSENHTTRPNGHLTINSSREVIRRRLSECTNPAVQCSRRGSHKGSAEQPRASGLQSRALHGNLATQESVWCGSSRGRVGENCRDWLISTARVA